MKPEHKKYINENIDKMSIKQIAVNLGLKERKVRKYLTTIEKKAHKTIVQTENTSDQHKNKTIFIVLLIVAVCVVYANSLGGPFLLDDDTLVKGNPLIQSISNIPKFFKVDIFAHNVNAKSISNSYRPLQTMTYAIDFSFWGNNPIGFHLTNILLHLSAVLLVFLFIKKISNNLSISFFTALLFAINPVNTACVSYISGRADILAAIFMLLSVINFISYARNERKVFLLISILSYLCAVYSKEYSILVLPLILFLYNVVFERYILSKARIIFFYAIPLFLYFPMRIQALSGLTSRSLELAGLGLFPRVLTSLKTLFIDVRILFLPYDLHFARTTKVEHSLFGSIYLVLTILGFALMVFFLKSLHKKWQNEKKLESGMIFFGILWFFISMIPLLNIVPLQVFHADNWLYFSSIGMYLAAVSISYYIWRLGSKKRALFRSVFSILVCFVFLCYGFMTVKRNEDYRGAIKFYLSNLKWRPSVKFYKTLAGKYGEKGDYNNALKYSKKAIETNEFYPSKDVIPAYYNLGISYMNLGRYNEAEEAFEKVMMSDSESLKENTKVYLKHIKKQQ